MTIEFEDDVDVGLNTIITLDCIDYDYKLERGIQKFPLKILKVFSRFFNALMGDYPLPPVLITDFGSTMEVFNLRCIIDEGSTDLTEAKMVEYSVLIRRNSFIASRTYLKIGDHVKNVLPDVVVYPGNHGKEGKIGDVEFKWKGEAHRYVVMTLPFHVGIELDVFG